MPTYRHRALADDVAQYHGPIAERQITLLPEQDEERLRLEAQADTALGDLKEAHRVRFRARLILGRALAALKRKKLYRDWGPWESYVPERFSLTARRADMLIEAYEAWRALRRGKTGYRPQSVNELEALAGLSPEQVVAVANAALAQVAEGSKARPGAEALRRLAATVRDSGQDLTAEQIERKRQTELMEQAMTIIRQLKPEYLRRLVEKITHE